MANVKRRAGLRDIAELAGVSVATVDGVLNDRGRVKPETAAIVRKIAESLGFENGVYKDEFVFNVVLQDPEQLYYQELGAAISNEVPALQREGIRANIHYLADTHDAAVSGKINELAESADGIAGVFVQNTLTVEALSRVQEQGKPVVTVLSDIRHLKRTA